ncbi:ATP-binding protein [Sphingomonas sp. LB-2]|uniref:sensor histidine kinase NtrY-like n=1 Tax=Sphingomonas caeni TaxID=2984949 RepID=UPI0022307FD6|nr:ATP-binding protein [Sphingomonas caeni]MCW3849163.1 ATP-binding protein [Sphingomonas caeni]
MDAVTEPRVTAKPRKWRLSVTPAIEFGVLAVAATVGIVTYFVVTSGSKPEELLAPSVMALLLIGNLIPAIALLVLIARRIAKRRAAQGLAGGGGRLHVRLVAIFLLLASIPILLTVIAASLMFQSGVQFWVSDRARGALLTSVNLVRAAQEHIVDRWEGEGKTMADDLERLTAEVGPPGSKPYQGYFIQNAFYRNFKQAVLFTYTPDSGVNVLNYWQNPRLTNPAPKDLLRVVFTSRVKPKLLEPVLRGEKEHVVGLERNLIWLVYPVAGIDNAYLYVGTDLDAEFIQEQVTEGQGVLDDYAVLQKRARSSQLSFNAALFGVALLIMILTVWIALAVADRLVRPLNLLVGAARRVAEGDLAARVPEQQSGDEVATLGETFNSMTERLQAQTGALISANAQAESRRALIEAVMSGVSAGVISIDAGRSVRLINESATELLRHDTASAVGHALSKVAPELDALLDGEAREAVVQVSVAGEPRTLAVKITRDEGGQVLTFDDITQQLLDQRRAAWSDVARRIAHEIKNPLTPIQLAAERLQRRYGKANEGEKDGTFARLTDTIVRQVGDLRRIVDEFSSFARMPKPLFRQESLLDIARQSMFLHEVAHPAIRFEMEAPENPPIVVCDRRQVGQALTNVVKNAVEAIEARTEGKKKLPKGEVVLTLRQEERRVTLTVADNGIGLPVERDRIAEPYMTTRARGTGLGLAIVKKIIEEHFGTIAFTDRKGGGTVVTICLDTEQLAGMASDADPGDDSEPRPAALTRTGTTQ